VNFQSITSFSFRLFISAATLAMFFSCNSRNKSEVIWTKNISIIGSQSSPRATDLNNDGTLDLVIGAGKNEYQQSDMGIIALDGKSGEILWKQTASDQVYGSATFLDVTGDGVNDIFIGGRSPQLKALDGASGKLLWEYQHERYKDDPILKFARYNFNNSVLVPDQNHDGFQDLLTVNGGNSYAQPNSEVDRFPAVLMLIDPRSGSVIASDTMPDGKESYMTPLCFPGRDTQDALVVFGTGGETIDGNLYIARISDLVSKKLSGSKVIASEKGHGFIAPPLLADITGDGILDVLAISHGSTAWAIDGKDYSVLWKRNFPNTECSNSFAAGYFTDDDIPDVFTFVSRGQWPNSAGSLQVMLDGKDGSVAYVDSMGCTGFSSPVVYDLNNDGLDEAIISINEFDCSLGFAGKTPRTIQNKLIAIEFKKHTVSTIDQSEGFKNIFSTPWIGDLDDDGYLDIVHCQYYHHGDLLLFLGMRIKRIATPVRIRKPVLWGSYLGSKGDGLFKGSGETAIQ
jgi:hypothetical protein